jgi:hypothetical protein
LRNSFLCNILLNKGVNYEKVSLYFLIIFFVFQFASCGVLDDISGTSNINLSINLPDKIVIANNARVSTLRSIDGKINRSGKSVYNFHFEVDIPCNHQDIIKIDDFILQEGDKAVATKTEFSWDM